MNGHNKRLRRRSAVAEKPRGTPTEQSARIKIESSSMGSCVTFCPIMPNIVTLICMILWPRVAVAMGPVRGGNLWLVLSTHV